MCLIIQQISKKGDLRTTIQHKKKKNLVSQTHTNDLKSWRFQCQSRPLETKRNRGKNIQDTQERKKNQKGKQRDKKKEKTNKEQRARTRILRSTPLPSRLPFMGIRRFYPSGFFGFLTSSFIKDQIEETAPSELRRLYRSRTFGRRVHPSAIGIAHHPCHAGSRWRTFALSQRADDSPITFEETSIGNVLLRVDGKPRTQYTPPTRWRWDSELGSITTTTFVEGDVHQVFSWSIIDELGITIYSPVDWAQLEA